MEAAPWPIHLVTHLHICIPLRVCLYIRLPKIYLCIYVWCTKNKTRVYVVSKQVFHFFSAIKIRIIKHTAVSMVFTGEQE